MGSNKGARLLLVVGFLAAWLGYDAWIVSDVILDPTATRSAAQALLETRAVRRGLADNLTKELERQLPGASKDPHLRPAVAAAVRDPRVATAFADTVSRVHEAILSDGGGDARTFTVDGRALRGALHDALVPGDTKLAARVERLPPLTVRLDADSLPSLHDPRSTAGGIAILGIVAALALITASLLIRHDRRSIARVGRRTAYLAATPLIVFAVLPRVLAHSSADAPQIASALLRVYGHRVLPSAVALAVVGLTIAVGALVWVRGEPERSPAAPDAAPRYTGPTPRARAGSEPPAITEKLYL